MGIYSGHIFGYLAYPNEKGTTWKAVFIWSETAYCSHNAHMDIWGGEEHYEWLRKRWTLFEGRRLVVYFRNNQPVSVSRSENSYRFHVLESFDMDPEIALHIIKFVEQIYQLRITY